MNHKFKLKQRVAALCMAAMMCCSLFPAGAFAEAPRADADGTFIMEQDNENVTPDAPQTDESNPDSGENTPEDSETPMVTQSADEDKPVDDSTDYTFDGAVLYTDLPDAPTGSYMGSQGLPVATGETKIGISAWPNDQLEESTDSYLSADTLNSDDLTMMAPLLEGTDYAVAPILAQVEYPADGSSLDVVLPNEVTVLNFYGAPADEATRSSLVHSEYTETSAAVMGLYVQADADFSAQLVYTALDGSTLTKALHVVIDRSRTMAAPFATATDVAAYAERPTPAVTSGKITKVEKVNGTWLIWFNGEEAYCCTHGANGQPKGCPPYTYTNTSLVSADQCIPGDHYGNQYRIWGGLDQLSMELLPDAPVAFSAEDTERISLLDFCRTIYDDTQLWLIENYPESTAAKIYLESAQALLDGAVAYAKPRGYYTYIYTPARSGWQTVALIGPEISEEETEEPKPVVQEYYASWEAPAQSASGTVDLTYGITTDKIQLKTLEKVDGTTIEIEPITKSGTIDGGSWSISPAGVQTVTTGGHTNDDNYQNNGGAASASWSVHYTVSKTVDGRSGSVGPYTTKEAADAAANSERDSAVAAIQAEAQSAVNNAIASAQAQLASLQFRYDEVTIPYGFESYWGGNGSHQTITVPANSNNAYEMRNAEWSLQINIKKTDSETGSQIAGDARYEIYQWDVVTGKYQPTGGYNTYSVQRQGDGTYTALWRLSVRTASTTSGLTAAKSIVKNGDSEQHFDVVRASEASAELAEQQTLGFYNDREHARVGVYKINHETGKYLAGAVFNLYTRDDIYDIDGNKLFSAGDLISTSPETVADGYTYFNCDVPIRGEWYGQSDRLDASTNSGNYFIRELRAPLGYYLNDAEMDVIFTYDGEILQVLDSTCANKPTEMWVSKRDLTNDEELPGATLVIKDAKDNIVDTWVSSDTLHRVTGLHFDEEYTLTEKRPADGYAVADDIVFRLERKTDADGHELDEADVYYLKDKKKFWIIPWEEWELLDDATVIMRDDITRVQISKVDIATGKELPGAELIIKDTDGNTVAQWVSADKPHYIEKLPAGDYTLTEITAPNGYQIAESITFTVLPTGELQTVVMKDAHIPEETPHEDTPSNTPQPTPNSTPVPTPAPASTPTATPAPMPVIPQTGDVFPFALLSAAVFGSIVGFGILAYKRRKFKMDESEH